MIDLIKIHSDDNGQLSWMRAACSVALLTGCVSILLQLLLAIIFCIVHDDLSVLENIEWMQPIALIGIALTGKVAQKQTEIEKK